MSRGMRMGLFSSLIIVLLLQSQLLLAQTISYEDNDQESQATGAPRPDSEIKSQIATSGRSLKDSVVQNPRNTVGFALGLYGLYDSNNLESDTPFSQDSIEGMISPTVFLNLGKRKTQFHADYSMERRVFRKSDFDTTFHTGNLAFAYTPNRNVTISIDDEARAAPSNLLSISGGFSPGLPGYNPVGPGISGYSYERVIMNRATGQIRYRMGRKNLASVFGSSQIFRYDTTAINDTDTYSVGGNFDRTLSRKLRAFAGFAYSHYDTASIVLRRDIKRVTGGLGYQIDKYWILEGSAGVEWIDLQNLSYTPTYFSAALSRSTNAKSFLISYSRGSQYQLGTPYLTSSDTVSFSIDQRLSHRSSCMFGAYYYRSEPYAQKGHQNTFISGIGFKYLLLANLVLSANGNYQYQDSAYWIPDSPSLRRYIVYAGIEILVPGVSRRR